MSEIASAPRLPVVDYLKMPEGEAPYLEGLKCTNCAAIYTDKRYACAKCYQRNTLQPYRLSNTGTLVTYTIVERSFPGIKVPYISAIIDMDSGGTIKANLINIEPKPENIAFGMAVELLFEQAPYGDKEGNEYLMFYFQPAGEKS
jgi:uncharacterized OB-fold protein